MNPLPHFPQSLPGSEQTYPGATVLQSAEQPSVSTWLPSSQTSPEPTMPLPQSSQGTPAVVQVKPDSIAEQVALQPSLLMRLPSSHFSRSSSLPLPQTKHSFPAPAVAQSYQLASIARQS